MFIQKTGARGHGASDHVADLLRDAGVPGRVVERLRAGGKFHAHVEITAWLLGASHRKIAARLGVDHRTVGRRIRRSSAALAFEGTDVNALLEARAQRMLTWSAIHHLLVRERGSASEHACIECGAVAHDWTLRHREPEVLARSRRCEGTNRRGTLFSPNLDDYDPRCRRCHLRYDEAGWFAIHVNREDPAYWERQARVGLLGSSIGNHTQHHVNKGVVKQDCEHCEITDLSSPAA